MKKQKISSKVVLLGDSGVGKTSITSRYIHGVFHGYHESTIGAAFCTKKHIIHEREVNFDIWDTAGQERYKTLAPMYLRGANAAIVVYDVTQPSTFEGCKNWVSELLKYCDSNVVIAIAGNKSDRRSIMDERVDEYIQLHKYIHVAVSAKDGSGITELFDKIAENVHARVPIINTPIKVTETIQEQTSYCCFLS